MSVFIETAIRQLCSKQDAVAALTIDNEYGLKKLDGDEPINVIAVFDGHGSDNTINSIRSLDLKEHFTRLDVAESIQRAIDINNMRNFTASKKEIYNSGSTLSFAKIYRNLKTKKIKIKIEWLGDSPILVFINNELIFESQLHNATNETEIQRLKNKGVFVKIKEVSYGFEVLDEHRIITKDSKYILFKNKDLLAMSRSLGHHRITGVDTQKHIIECNTDDEVKVIIFSDGVGDMLNMGLDLYKLKKYSAEEIVELAEKRWKQEWFCGIEGTSKESFEENGYDDCCCAIWWQKK